jgi:hypothetical protein
MSLCGPFELSDNQAVGFMIVVIVGKFECMMLFILLFLIFKKSALELYEDVPSVANTNITVTLMGAMYHYFFVVEDADSNQDADALWVSTRSLAGLFKETNTQKLQE